MHYMYVYIYIERERCGILTHRRVLLDHLGRRRRLIGWSNNQFNNLHFILSLETHITINYMFQVKCRPFSWNKMYSMNLWNAGCRNDSKTRAWKASGAGRGMKTARTRSNVLLFLLWFCCFSPGETSHRRPPMWIHVSRPMRKTIEQL